MPIPKPTAERSCGTPGHGREGTVSLPVLADPKHAIRKSKMGPRRAAVLIGVHVVILIHILHWAVYGMTLSPVEPSESMYTINLGKVNTGFVFFAAAILSTLILGRFFCGWGCHIVALQDLCAWMMKKVGVKPKPFRSRLLIWAPVVLAIYMFAWPTIKREVIRPLSGKALWESLAPWLGEAGDRPELRAAFSTTNFWETFPPWYVAIPFTLVCGFAIVYFLGAKGFCTYGCPYGGIFGPADLVAPGRIRVTDACEHCGHCTAVCTSNVRVHEEVRDYGMVVDPGCMKCMDCVSVCPNDALYFGFGKPAIAAKARTASPARFKSRVFDLSWKEELLYGAVFLALVIGFRGMLGLIPLLMAMAIAGIGTFMLWKVVCMVRTPSVRVHGLQLRFKGRVTLPGAVAAALTLATVAAGAWGFIVNASLWRGHTLDARIAAPLDRVLTRDYTATDAERALARSAEAHFRRAGTRADGGIGWDDSVDRALRVTRLLAILGDRQGAEATLRRALETAKKSKNPSPAAIEDPLIRVIGLRSRDAAEFEASLRELVSVYPDLSSAYLGLSQLALQREDRANAEKWVERALASRLADVRNTLFASDLLLAMDRMEMAVGTVRKGISAHPKSAALHERLGLMLAAGGKIDEGLTELKAAADLEPTNATLAGHIARVLREAGRESEATEWQERANRIARSGIP